MSRASLTYGQVREAKVFAGFDPETPIAGLYRMRLRSGGAWVAVRIWFGLPIEPWTREPMDRAPRFNATINGEWADIASVWPKCAADAIDDDEYRHLIATRDWAVQHMPDSALANPRRRFDALSSPILF